MKTIYKATFIANDLASLKKVSDAPPFEAYYACYAHKNTLIHAFIKAANEEEAARLAGEIGQNAKEGRLFGCTHI